MLAKKCDQHLKGFSFLQGMRGFGLWRFSLSIHSHLDPLEVQFVTQRITQIADELQIECLEGLQITPANRKLREEEDKRIAGEYAFRPALGQMSVMQPVALAFVASLCYRHKEITMLSLAKESVEASSLLWLFLRPPPSPGHHHLRHLSHLDLGHNAIGARGCAFLASALPYLTSLEHLQLHSANIDGKACCALAIGLKFCHTLQHLNLMDNEVRGDGVAALVPALQHLSSLQTLNLHNNRLAPEACEALVRGVAELHNLKLILLTLNMFPSLEMDVEHRLNKAFAHRQKDAQQVAEIAVVMWATWLKQAIMDRWNGPVRSEEPPGAAAEAVEAETVEAETV